MHRLLTRPLLNGNPTSTLAGVFTKRSSSSSSSSSSPSPPLDPLSTWHTYSPGSLQLRRRKSNLDFWGRRGAGRPPYPRSTPLRVPGVDLSLQERLDKLYFREEEAHQRRRDIGLSSEDDDGGHRRQRVRSKDHRSQMLELRKLRRSDPELERRARTRTLNIDLEAVREEREMDGEIFKDVVVAADLYGVYEDLFGKECFFQPTVNLRVEYDLSTNKQEGEEASNEDEMTTVLPVFRGNVVKPFEAMNRPHVSIGDNRSKEVDEERPLYTLVMTTPDGHFEDCNKEYCHWMVVNIRDGDVAKGDTLIDYMRPFPPFGAGYFRYCFVLYKQKTLFTDTSYEKIQPCLDLHDRTFSTRQLLQKHGDLRPAALAFFQSDYDSSLRSFYHDVLQMKEPRFEYHFLEPYVEPWSQMFPLKGRQPFNLFLDRYRDPKELQEQVLRKKLATHHPFDMDTQKHIKFPNAHPIDHDLPQWRRREIERERLRLGYYKDLDHKQLRRDPSKS